MPEGMKQLDGKVVLVVGASAGIGADAARVFARDGASVMLAARTEGSLRELADELTTSGFDAGYVIGDVSVGAVGQPPIEGLLGPRPVGAGEDQPQILGGDPGSGELLI